MATEYLTRFSTFLNKNLKLIILALLLLQAALVFAITSLNFLTYDKGVWFNVIKNIKQNNKIPYLTTSEFILGPSEYPVLFTYFLLPFSLLPLEFNIFSIALGLVQVLFSALIIYTLSKLLKDKKLALTLFLCPVFLIMSLSRFDLMPAGILLFSYYQAKKGRHYFSGALLALASCLKLFPLVFVPAFYFIKNLDYKRFFIAFILVAFALYIPVLILEPQTIFYPLSFTSSDYRPESLFGFLGFMGLSIPSWVASLYKYSVTILILLIAFLKLKAPLRIGACLTILLMIVSPLFSPQWNLWLTPLLLLLNVSPLLIVLFDVITFIEFPFIWGAVAGLTGFTHEKFLLGGAYSILFVALNLLRYLFLYYFLVFIIRTHSRRRRSVLS